MIFQTTAMAGRSVLVTGASSGIGRAVAILIAACGGRVTLVGRDEARLKETLEVLDGMGHKLVAAALDTIEQAASVVSSAAADVAGLHGIFHGAGIEAIGPSRLVKTKTAEPVLGAALYGALGIAKSCGGSNTLHDGASVVLMSSVSARRGKAGMAVYSATKAGVEGLARSLACELSPRKVRVNAIAAGAIKTPMHGRLAQILPDRAMQNYEAAHPLGFGEPEDVANAALFLLSDASRWMTGTTLDVDGGYLGS